MKKVPIKFVSISGSRPAYSVPKPITHKHLRPLLQWTERAVPFRWNESLGVHLRAASTWVRFYNRPRTASDAISPLPFAQTAELQDPPHLASFLRPSQVGSFLQIGLVRPHRAANVASFLRPLPIGFVFTTGRRLRPKLSRLQWLRFDNDKNLPTTNRRPITQPIASQALYLLPPPTRSRTFCPRFAYPEVRSAIPSLLS
jgi:hypothetical protein